MNCPICSGVNTLRVVDKRDRYNGVHRRRECTECLTRFASMERLERIIQPRHYKTRGDKHGDQGSERAGDPFD